MNLKVSLAENIFYPKWRILREELLDIFYRLFIVVSISLGAEDKVSAIHLVKLMGTDKTFHKYSLDLITAN